MPLTANGEQLPHIVSLAAPTHPDALACTEKPIKPCRGSTGRRRCSSTTACLTEITPSRIGDYKDAPWYECTAQRRPRAAYCRVRAHCETKRESRERARDR